MPGTAPGVVSITSARRVRGLSLIDRLTQLWLERAILLRHVAPVFPEQAPNDSL
jgi:hypothetical protein